MMMPHEEHAKSADVPAQARGARSGGAVRHVVSPYAERLPDFVPRFFPSTEDVA